MMRIYLCWFAQFPINQIVPLLNLGQLLQQANCKDPIALTRLVRVNWIFQDLTTGSIRKPIVLDHDLRTIVGDNRLMALSLLPNIETVPVLAQLREPKGTVIESLAQLPVITGLADATQISWNPIYHDPLTQPVDWFDIGDQSTSHHPMDRVLCERAMTRYRKQHPDIVFDTAWCKSEIDWNRYF